MNVAGLAGLAVLAGAGALTGVTRSTEGAVSPPGTVHVVTAAAQGAARSYWTPAAMTAAAPDLTQSRKIMAGSGHRAAPRGTPDPVSFDGVPTVGALLYTKGGRRHFCTASVVTSTVRSLVLTAAHCVYAGGYSSHVEFVPGYRDGATPFGAWPVAKIIVAKGWRQRQDPSQDYAFLEVVPPPLSAGQIQDVTGGLKLGFRLRDAQHITVIGYNNTDKTPIKCATKSFKVSDSQMEFYCRGFWYGTSGGPWIINYDDSSGNGTVFGVIGGYECGGYTSWASYSTIFRQGTESLFRQAEAAAV